MFLPKNCFSIRNGASLIFHSSCFQDFFFLVLSFQQFDYEAFGMDFFGFIIFGVNLACRICKLYHSPNLGSFQPFFFMKFFCTTQFSPSATVIMQMFHHLVLSHRPLRLCSLPYPPIFFSLLFRWNKSYCSIFKLTTVPLSSTLLLSPSNEVLGFFTIIF